MPVSTARVPTQPCGHGSQPRRLRSPPLLSCARGPSWRCGGRGANHTHHGVKPPCDGKEAGRRILPALEFLPQRSPRGQSEMLLDLAGIALLNTDADEAVQRARDSLARAREAQSVACVDRVRRFRLRLHPYGNLPDIAALDHELSAV